MKYKGGKSELPNGIVVNDKDVKDDQMSFSSKIQFEFLKNASIQRYKLKYLKKDVVPDSSTKTVSIGRDTNMCNSTSFLQNDFILDNNSLMLPQGNSENVGSRFPPALMYSKCAPGIMADSTMMDAKLANSYQFFGENSSDRAENITQSKRPMHVRDFEKNWVILSSQAYSDDVYTFLNKFQKTIEKMPFMCPTPEVVFVKDENLNAYLSSIEKIVQGNPFFVLCVLTSISADFYNKIKEKLCVNYDGQWQVVLHETLKNDQFWVHRKMAIQINCKFEGAPRFIDIPEKGFMIVGLDMCFDEQTIYDGLNKMMMATMNKNYTDYFSCVESHANIKYKWNNFVLSIGKAILKYKEQNHELPKGIVVYKNVVKDDQQLSFVYKTLAELVKNYSCKQFYKKSLYLAYVVTETQAKAILFDSDTMMNNSAASIRDLTMD